MKVLKYTAAFSSSGNIFNNHVLNFTRIERRENSQFASTHPRTTSPTAFRLPAEAFVVAVKRGPIATRTLGEWHLYT